MVRSVPELPGLQGGLTEWEKGGLTVKYISLVDRAFYLLKGYCEKQTNCDNCRFDNGECCVLQKCAPLDWEKPKKKEG